RYRQSKISIALIENNSIFFDFGIKIPVRPMIGTIGVAPSKEPVSTLYPGDHGGNMDLNEIHIGSIVYLPVFVRGALLSLGDIHASMGDGEVTGTGVEIGATIHTQIELIK